MAPLWSVKKEVFKGNPGISSIMDKRLPKTARKCFLHSMYDILFKIVSITDWDWKWILQAICSFYTERFKKKNHVIPWFLDFWLISRWISTWILHCAVFLQYKVTFKGQTKSKWFFQADVSSKKQANKFDFKVQRAVLTCDVIRKVAPFVLSKLWILVADWSMHWSRDTFLIKLRL